MGLSEKSGPKLCRRPVLNEPNVGYNRSSRGAQTAEMDLKVASLFRTDSPLPGWLKIILFGRQIAEMFLIMIDEIHWRTFTSFKQPKEEGRGRQGLIRDAARQQLRCASH
jgi:hypothetical protein